MGFPVFSHAGRSGRTRWRVSRYTHFASCIVGKVSKRKIAVGGFVLAGVAGLLFLGTTLWNASRSLRDAQARVTQESLIPFRTVSLDRPLPSGFESISSPAQFRDAALFQG